MNTTKQISLNIDDQSQFIYVNAMQGDSLTRYVVIQFLDGINIFPIPDKSIARIAAIKPDHTQIFNDCEIIKNKIRVHLSEQLLAVEGIVPCTVTLFHTETEERISGAGFNLLVNKSQFSNLNLSSFSESTTLLSLLTKLEKVETVISTCQTTSNEGARMNKMIEANFNSIKSQWEDLKSQMEDLLK